MQTGLGVANEALAPQVQRLVLEGRETVYFGGRKVVEGNVPIEQVYELRGARCGGLCRPAEGPWTGPVVRGASGAAGCTGDLDILNYGLLKMKHGIFFSPLSTQCLCIWDKLVAI